MNRKTLVKKLNLSEEALENIKKAVQKAENKTTGEIAVAVTAESSDYSFWELAASVVLALIVFAAMLPSAPNIRRLYESINWASSEWYLPAVYGITSFVVILAGFMLFNVPALDRIIIPSIYMNRMVSNRAARCFTECGVYCTENHTGILIFVSYLEKQVRVVADKGISEKIGNDLWQMITQELVENIAKGNVEQGFVTAIEKCGELLAENFPCGSENKNELSDGLIILNA